jgi:hypothetical protein
VFFQPSNDFVLAQIVIKDTQSNKREKKRKNERRNELNFNTKTFKKEDYFFEEMKHIHAFEYRWLKYGFDKNNTFLSVISN